MNKKKLISAIRKAIREKDVTLACKLVPEKTFSAKYNWVKEKIGPNHAKKLNDLRWWKHSKNELYMTKVFFQKGGYAQYDNHYYKTKALNMLRKLITEKLTNYSKIAMYGLTHLYFCSPIYEHKDYNKVRCCEIEGNEKFCEKIIEISDRIYNKKGGNL